jgi:large subunit ribosomal protein L29e
MAKSKNHTNHNQNKKDHKNGIQKPRRQKYMTCRMVLFDDFFESFANKN